MVYRYDVSKTDDGVGGNEGAFCLCKHLIHPPHTAGLTQANRYFMVRACITPTPDEIEIVYRGVEALTRAGQYDSALLLRARTMFEVGMQWIPITPLNVAT
jgi:hypothetical protein